MTLRQDLLTQLRSLSQDYAEICDILRLEEKQQSIAEITAQLQHADGWENQQQVLQQQRALSRLKGQTEQATRLGRQLQEFGDLIELTAEDDEPMLESLRADIAKIDGDVARLRIESLFYDEHDAEDCFVDIQAGSGGTEAQDWAQMLLRMYIRFCDRETLSVKILEESPGDVAGIKRATLQVKGKWAYGLLRGETGIHRLVRKSPFDSNHKRHTSFASVFTYPQIDDSVNVELALADCRIDTYRASGAGGQHVNTTDSAVRITHLPTGIVVQCQNDRSQHKNKATAMNMLRSRLYQHEMAQRQAVINQLEDSKDDISWGNQIRSYVLDQSRIKDLRTHHESANTKAVLDGDLRPFIEAGLAFFAKKNAQSD